jgi:hypothetical protein
MTNNTKKHTFSMSHNLTRESKEAVASRRGLIAFLKVSTLVNFTTASRRGLIACSKVRTLNCTVP